MQRNSRTAAWTLGLVSAVLFMVTLDNLVVTTALPRIRIDLGASLSGLEWIVNAYTLSFAALLMTGAALGDRFGRRRMLRDRARDLHRRFGRGRARAEHRRAHRCPRGPGGRWRARAATDPDAAVRGVSGGQAGHRARDLVRRQRARRRARSGDRRCRRQQHLVALDLLAQRAGRTDRAPARVGT